MAKKLTPVVPQDQLATVAALTPEQIEELYAYDPDEPWWCRLVNLRSSTSLIKVKSARGNVQNDIVWFSVTEVNETVSYSSHNIYNMRRIPTHIMAANYADDPEIRQRHLDAMWQESEETIHRF